MGFSIIIFEGSLVKAGLAGKAPDERHLFTRLARVAAILIGLFIVVRFGELIYNDKLHYVLQGDFYSLMFWLEVGLLSLPIFTLFLGDKFSDSRWLFISALCMIGGSALWRMNYSIIMFDRYGLRLLSVSTGIINFNRVYFY